MQTVFEGGGDLHAVLGRGRGGVETSVPDPEGSVLFWSDLDPPDLDVWDRIRIWILALKMTLS
jgi:hypothetical protein